MKRIKLMDIISEFAKKENLPETKVRNEMTKALSFTRFKELCDPEFFVETLAAMIIKELRRRSYR